jgi:hypothetical protein
MRQSATSAAGAGAGSGQAVEADDRIGVAYVEG